METKDPQPTIQPDNPRRSSSPRTPIGPIFKQAASNWAKHKVPRLAAALAYYTVFSLPGIVVISLAIAGLVFGGDAARGEIERQLQDLLGDDGAKAINEMIASAQKPGKGLLATGIGLIVLLVGASGVFGELQDGLNTIWEVEPKGGGGIWVTIKDRFLSFAMVLGIGFLLLVSLVLSATLSALGKWSAGTLPLPPAVLSVLNLGISFSVITVLFGMIFKVLPDVMIRWRDVWMGAAVTAFLFTIGKYALGLYLGHAAVGSAFGAAGSLIVVLVWIYYSAQILYMGAEFTQAYVHAHSSAGLPSQNPPATAEKP